MRGSSAIDMIGKRFGRLIVLERVENIGDQAAWKCLCDCLCKNCHSDFHHLYGAKPISPVDSLTEYLGRSPHEI